MKQLRAIVTGRVQGVCFRAETVSVARRLALNGFARNLPGGEVEVVATGAQEALQELLDFIHRGPMLARVEGVAIDWNDDTPITDGFQIRY